MRASPSGWDSEIFGVSVGILRATPPPAAREVRRANPRFGVVFVKSGGWHDVDGAVALDRTYDMGCHPECASDVRIKACTADRRVLALASTAFSDSRFLRDQRLAGRSGSLYRKWVRDAEGRLLRLGDAGDAFAFMVEGRDPDGAGRVELVAVAEASRGAGLGRALLRGAFGRAGSPPEWRVRVSASNWRAIRFYESLGFRVRSASTTFHVWRDEG